MKIFEMTDYKRVIRERAKELNRTRRAVTLKSLAAALPVQYTYLSRVLNDVSKHLSEDHVYVLCQKLELLPEETDFLLLLRARAVCVSASRKAYLDQKIDQARKAQRIQASVQEFNSMQLNMEMAYLFDPQCVLLHVALHIPAYARNPKLVAPALGLSQKQLQEKLLKLRSLEIIELSDDGASVKQVLKRKIHYGKTHPLMRMHQSALKQLSASHSARLPEEDKDQFMVSFTADQASFEKIQEAFRAFLDEIEKIVSRAKNESVYQLSFETFRWF